MTTTKPPEFTRQEIQLLECAAAGMRWPDAAQYLKLKHERVRYLSIRLFAKLGVDNRTEAVARAYEAGLLPADIQDIPPLMAALTRRYLDVTGHLPPVELGGDAR